MLHSQIILTMTWYAPFKTPSNEKYSEQNIKYPNYSHFSYAYIIWHGLKLIKTPQLDHLTNTKFPIYPNIKLKPPWSLLFSFLLLPISFDKKICPYKPPSKIRKHSPQWHSTLVEATPPHNWRPSVESRCQMGTKIVILRAHRACKRLLQRWDEPMVAMKLPMWFFGIPAYLHCAIYLQIHWV